MAKQNPIHLFVIALTACCTMGCAGMKPFGFLGAQNGIAPNSSVANNSNDPSSQFAGRGVGQPRPKENQNIAQSFGGAVVKVGDSVAKAVTPKSKVIPADDPLNLESDPGPLDAQIFISAARIHEHQGNFPAAIDQYKKALEREPGNLKALLSLARVYDRQEQFQQASDIYKQALQHHPGSAMAYNDHGLCLARQGRLSESTAALLKAVELDRKKKLYRNNLAVVLVEGGRNEEAFQNLAAAHGPAIAHYNLGYFLHQRNETKEAAQHFAQAVEIDPSLTAARRMLQQVGAVASDSQQPSNQQDVASPETAASTNVFIGDNR